MVLILAEFAPNYYKQVLRQLSW